MLTLVYSGNRKQYVLEFFVTTYYVDDNLILGHPEAVEDVIEHLKENGLDFKVK